MPLPLVLGIWGTSGHTGTVSPLTQTSIPSRIARRVIARKIDLLNGMPTDHNAASSMDQALALALRENLERIQKTSEELNHAVGDVVAACSNGTPANALPAMLRAQTAAASISAALDVLGRFAASSFQSRAHLAMPSASAAPASVPAQSPVHRAPARSASPAPEPPPFLEAFEQQVAAAPVAEPSFEEEFDVNRLSPEEQELHRRANRVAKVSMQDIKMLRPEQVRLGRENKDLCIRLRDDIEKAHREYDRRFKPIMDHPVDYFYRWLVEILADGDPHALGEYPYASPARQR